MLKSKLLVIAPYPIKKPGHGGQKRVAALVENYKKIFESVKFVGIFHESGYPDYEESDIPLGQKENLEAVAEQPLLVDQIIGRSLANDSHVRSHFAEVLKEYRPDIIEIEQVFLYDGLSSLLKDMGLSPKLIFSSQNIEYKMKGEIYRSLEVDKKVAAEAVEYTKKLEEKFSQNADLVIAVSENDAKEHKKMGAKNVVVAPNGIARSHEEPVKSEATNRFLDIKNDGAVDTFVTFIGSGHPPNYLGFLELIGDDTAFLPNTARLVIGGGVSEYIKSKFPKKDNPRLWRRLIATGSLTEDDLYSLISKTDIFILPITSGGGSNLKTAEAILSGKKIVATSFAFRGFERYLSLPNIYVADAPGKFRDAINEAIKMPLVERTNREIDLAQKVQWGFCLGPIRYRVIKLAVMDRISQGLQKPVTLMKRVYHRLKKLAYNQ